MSVAPKRSWVSRNVIVLGTVSLLTDSASEMMVPLLPAFIMAMGAGAMALGWIEGIADAISSVLKLFAGRWADRIGRHKPFVVVGYSLASIARPFMALATAPWHVLMVRGTDRVGKGLRTSPRDALIAMSVEPSQRGAAFGLHRAMDHAGAVIGPLAAAAFLYWISSDIPTLFLLTAIPGVLVIAVALFGVQEVPRLEAKPEAAPKPRALARFLVPLGLFTLGKSSEVFLLLKASAGFDQLAMFPLLWVGLSLVKMLSSVPGGKISDRLGRRRTIAAGWLLFAAVYAALAIVENQYAVCALIGAYGLYCGLTEGAEKALVSELAPANKQGAAFGWYHVTLGLLALAASGMFGALYELVSSRAAFLTSATLAVASTIALWALSRTRAA